MVHNGLDKLVDPEGFAKFVVEPYHGFLQHDEPLSFVTWTYLAAAAEIAGAAGLTLGFLTRLSAMSLFSTMGLAVYFHIAQSGLEGFPLGVVEKHQYAYEPAALYCLIYFYFVVNGGGALSLDNAPGAKEQAEKKAANKAAYLAEIKERTDALSAKAAEDRAAGRSQQAPKKPWEK